MSNLFSRLSLRANIVTAAMAAFFLAACGGDGNKANEPDPSAEADFVVDSFGDLSVCTGNREGATAYVKDEDHDYICTDGDWAIDTNADTRKKSSNSKDEANSSNSKDKAKSSSSRHSEDSSSSRHCEDCKDEAISSSSSAKSSSSSVTLATPCKTETEDNCEYGELVDARDGKTYKTVKIGEQTWMAENLNFETGNSWCGGGRVENEGDCSKYGRLYTWAAAVGRSEDDCGYGHICSLFGKVHGVCPEGWLLPDTTEWSKLFTAVGGESVAGKMLKAQTGWGWNNYNDSSGNGTDAYGFSALPAGGRYNDGNFINEGLDAQFWSATEDNSDRAYYMSLFYHSDHAYLNNSLKRFAFSVRCLKDDP